MTARVSYAAGGAALACEVIAAWNRDELAPITGSSGLKDYFRNQVWSAFESMGPHIDRIVMLHAHGPTFALFRTTAGDWYDAAAERVIIETAAQEAAQP
jgi:hypothetical protein